MTRNKGRDGRTGQDDDGTILELFYDDGGMILNDFKAIWGCVWDELRSISIFFWDELLEEKHRPNLCLLNMGEKT